MIEIGCVHVRFHRGGIDPRRRRRRPRRRRRRIDPRPRPTIDSPRNNGLY